MPVQINEIIIRAVVDPLSTDSDSKEMDCDPAGSGPGSSDIDLIEKVLEIIREKNER